MEIRQQTASGSGPEGIQPYRIRDCPMWVSYPPTFSGKMRSNRSLVKDCRDCPKTARSAPALVLRISIAAI